MPPKLLVTGADGLLGRALAGQGAARRVGLLAFGRSRLDITDPIAVTRSVAESGADIVVNAAAYTAVDQAEHEPARAFAVNAEGPGHLARTCAAHGLALIHLSTDYVFDGAKATPYLEDDPVGPLSVYGASKEAGERAVRTALQAHVVLRTSWLFGAHARSLVAAVQRAASQGTTMRWAADQIGSPTAAADLADAILDIACALDGDWRRFGTFHYAGAGTATRHGLAEAVAELCLPRDRPRPRI
ncbi:MAG TPA: dTDP-4-dehydrorhamnose reductase, partial [Acidimicrobiales bacterium]|nr:dTDP-4-dehydrorhamnose reductase [Acidimicrobiales bacterium]